MPAFNLASFLIGRERNQILERQGEAQAARLAEQREDELNKWRFTSGMKLLDEGNKAMDRLIKTGVSPDQREHYAKGFQMDLANKQMGGFGIGRLFEMRRSASNQERKNMDLGFKAVNEMIDQNDWPGAAIEMTKMKSGVSKEYGEILDQYIENIEGSRPTPMIDSAGKISDVPKYDVQRKQLEGLLDAGQFVAKRKQEKEQEDKVSFARTKAGLDAGNIRLRSGLAGYKPKTEAEAIRLKEAGRSKTTINLGGQPGLQKPVITKLQNDVIKASGQIDTLNQIEQSFKPEFLTWAGRGEKWFRKQVDKIGAASEEQKQEIYAYQDWYAPAKQSFLAYRKWITGVAGGEKEMKEIAKSYPDPDRNSPTEYMANLRRTKDIIRKIQLGQKQFLEKGISPTKRQLLDAAFGKDKASSKSKSLLSPGATNFIKKYEATK